MTERKQRKRLEQISVEWIQSFMEADGPVMMFTLCAVMTVFPPFLYVLCTSPFWTLPPMGKRWYGGMVMVDFGP